MRKLLLISNSAVHGGGYLEHCTEQIKQFLTKSNVKQVLFVPYALYNRDSYALTAKTAFEKMGFELESIHTQPSSVDAVRKAEAVFIGGGNTFRLLKTLYDENIVSEIRKRVLEETRETRIKQFHEAEDTPPVLGLREGSMLHVEGDRATLLGPLHARLFQRGQEPVEYPPDSDLSFLLKH